MADFNIFAQQKRVPGQVYGETPEQFAAGKQEANSQTGVVSQPTVVLPSSREVEQKNIAAPSTYTPQKAIDPNSSTAGMDYLNSLYTSPEEEKRLRKASVANQRILAVGDALRHIGNIFHTVNYAPSQQFNQPWAEEQARYERGKALRDKANLTYINYQQAKAAQDAKQRQWEKEYEYKQGLLSHYADQEARLRDKDAFDKENKEARRDLDREKFELDKAYKQGKINIAQYNAQTSRIRAVKAGRAGGGGGGKYWAYDPEGNIHYYPNRTMWEQGIAEFGSGYPQTETLTNTNAIGDQTQRQVKVKPTTTGGALARKAHGNSAVSGFSIRNNNQDNKKGTNVSRFSIRK